MGDARHSHVAVAPRLARDPFHRLTDVLNRLRIDIVEYSSGFVSSRNVDDPQCVSPANVEIEITRLHETPRVGKPFRHYLRGLGCFGIRVHRKNGGKFTCSVWPEDVRIECNSAANRNGNIPLDGDSILPR